MKTQLVTLANKLRATGLTLSEAFKRAWAIIKLKAGMSARPTSFFYKKEDGTIREAIGYYGDAPQATASAPAPAGLVIKYFDMVANGWRSFRADRFISLV